MSSQDSSGRGGIPSDFNTLADDYAAYRTSYSPALFQSIFDYARLGAQARVLDLACGTGLGMAPYLEHGFAVTGVDIAPGMIDFARRQFGDNARAQFCIGRAEALPFADETFDLISCAQAFHWFDPEAAFGECARVLKKDGALAVFWKHAARDDVLTVTVEQIIRDWMGEAAAVKARDHVAEHEDGWSTFWNYVSASPQQDGKLFCDGQLRLSSFVSPRTVEAFVGYQRSREKIRTVLGDRRPEFLDELRRRLSNLAPAGAEIPQRQVEYLFLGRVSARTA